jgi:hypothetical protein
VGPGQAAALHTTHTRTHTRNPTEISNQSLQDDTLPMPPWERSVWRGVVRLDGASGEGMAQPHAPGVRATRQLLERPPCRSSVHGCMLCSTQPLNHAETTAGVPAWVGTKLPGAGRRWRGIQT